MEKENLKTVNETCANCGYPYNGARKHCKVCGNDLRENKKVGYKVLPPSKIVAHVLVAVALILAIVGVFGAISTSVTAYDDIKTFTQTGISYFFRDGWTNVINSFGSLEFGLNAVQFGLAFASYILALLGTFAMVIVFIQSLVSRYKAKQTRFCVCKFFKYQILLLLPYVFAVNLFITNYTSYENFTVTYTCGWGVLLVALSLLIGFIATCINHINSECKKPTDGPFALKQIATFLLIFVGVYGFMGIAKLISVNDTNNFNLASIFDVIRYFITNQDIPLSIGVSLIAGASIFGAVLALIIAFVFTKNSTRKIVYSALAFVLTVAGVSLSYYGLYSIITFYNASENLVTGVTCGAIVAQAFALIALLLTISYKCIEVKRTKLANK